MKTSCKIVKTVSKQANVLYIGDTSSKWEITGFSKTDIDFLKKSIQKKNNPIVLESGSRHVVVLHGNQSADHSVNEDWRKDASKVLAYCNGQKLEDITIINTTNNQIISALVLEGLLLANYEFLKYKSKKDDQTGSTLKTISITEASIKAKDLNTVQVIIEATCLARDLVNEPLSFLTAEQLSKEIVASSKKGGFKAEILTKSKIKALKMGGLLAVNLGSPNPPTFNILEWKPKKAKNKNPLVLVGKGVVYDTGGLSLKPTPNSMDLMKSDMGGAAAVIGAIYAVSKLKLPVHVIGLVPATENRPGGNAYVPGDVIKMHNGSTVEVLNTDAEGRMILADALSYAKKYKPELVIDLATLTGAAARAIGPEGIVFMGTAKDEVKSKLVESGSAVHERLVEFPLWKEYDAYIQSDIADIKNIGGASAGAITAGAFLKTFTDYPWIHLDIAGMAFLPKDDGYRKKNGTGVGVRLLVDFIKNIS